MNSLRVPQSDRLLMKSYMESRSAVLRWIAEGIPALPAKVRPTHYAEGERVRFKPTNSLSDALQLEAFLERHRGGFFLHGEKFKVDVTLSDSPHPSEVTFWASSADSRFTQHGVAILETLDEFGPVYGYAASWDEYRARNGLSIAFIDGGQMEGWCGRDFRRYVPGLFWLNYFSKNYAGTFQIDVGTLQSRINATLLATKNGHILKLYEAPDRWGDRDNEVADAIFETPRFFSIRRVSVPTKVHRRDALRVAQPIWDQWP